jgi:hypothetical protein
MGLWDNNPVGLGIMLTAAAAIAVEHKPIDDRDDVLEHEIVTAKELL